jgi:hypothetical protein
MNKERIRKQFPQAADVKRILWRTIHPTRLRWAEFDTALEGPNTVQFPLQFDLLQNVRA